MAQLLSTATGDFTNATTWKLCDPTSAMTSTTSVQQSAIGTSYTSSQSFTPGAITIDGIAVRVYTTTGTVGSQTVTICLGQAGVPVAGTVVTINISAFNQTFTTYSTTHGWYLFKFESPVTLTAATAYTVMARASATGQINLHRNATSNNWCRLLRTTTNQSPANGDDCWIAPEMSNPATVVSHTVTYDNTDTGITLGELGIGQGCVLQFEESPATDYWLAVSTGINIWIGELHIGSSVTPFPATSSATVHFPGAAGFNIMAGGLLSAYGKERQRSTVLTATAAASSTVIQVESTAGWESGDLILFPPTLSTTTTTISDYERIAVDTVDSATQITLATGLAVERIGSTTNEVRGEACNLTSNVIFYGTDTTSQGFIWDSNYGNLDINNVQMYYMGGNNTTNQNGIVANPIGNSNFATVNSCSFYDGRALSYGFYNNNSSSKNLTFTNNVVHNTGQWLRINSSLSDTNITIDGNFFGCQVATLQSGIYLGDIGGSFRNNRIVGNTNIVNTVGTIVIAETGTMGDFSNNVIHNGYGIRTDVTSSSTSLVNWTLDGWTFFNMSTLVGMTCISIDNQVGRGSVTISNCSMHGSSRNFFDLNSQINSASLRITGCNFYDTINSVFSQIQEYNYSRRILIEDCFINEVSTAIVRIANLFSNIRVLVRNCTLGSGPLVNSETSLLEDYDDPPYIAFQNTGNLEFIAYYYGGGVGSENLEIIGNSLALMGVSTRILRSGRFFVRVAANTTPSVSLEMRRSSGLDGYGNYDNADVPILVMKANPRAGVMADTTIASQSDTTRQVWHTVTGNLPSSSVDYTAELYIQTATGTGSRLNVRNFQVIGADPDVGLGNSSDGLFYGFPQPEAGGSGGSAYFAC